MGDSDSLCDKKSYEYHKKKFEKECSKINGNLVFIIDYVDDNGARYTMLHTKRKIIKCYRHVGYIDEKGKCQSFIKKWLTDPNMRIY